MIRVRCVHAGTAIETELASDTVARELLELAAREFQLPQEDPLRRYMLVNHSNGSAVALDERIGNVHDGGRAAPLAISVIPAMEPGGIGEAVVIAGSAVAAGKVAVDAARVGVDIYRARTERMKTQLERDKFEADHPETADRSTD